MISDAGVILLGATDRKLGLIQDAPHCMADPRSPLLITHSVADLPRQRVYGVVLGWKDLNNHGAFAVNAAQLMALFALHNKIAMSNRQIPLAENISRLSHLAMGDSDFYILLRSVSSRNRYVALHLGQPKQ